MVKFATTVLAFFLSIQFSQAQSGITLPDSVSESPVRSVRQIFSLSSSDAPESSFNTSYKKVSHKNRFPITSYTDPAINFVPNAPYMYAGDINGDGKDDLITTYAGTNIADERTEDTSDKTAKSLVFLGGNEITDQDQLLYTQIRPVGDLNGDGYDDALGENHDNTLNYYFGSPNGYLMHEASFPDSLYSRIAGFRDFNQDGYQDIISLQEYSAAIQIIFGGATVDQFIGKNYSAGLSSYLIPARLDSDIIASVRMDHDEDIINTSILIIDPSDLSIKETLPSSFSFDFNTSFHSGLRAFRAIDTNADGKDEIYLTEVKEFGGLNISLVLQASSEGYSNHTRVNSSSQVPVWIPIGDIDDDGRTDYARTFDNYLQIGYGPEDISQGVTPAEPWIEFETIEPSLPVNSSSSDPQYHRLGDFNGDGIDDFVVRTDSDDKTAQRIYYGSTDRTFDNFLDNSYIIADFDFEPRHVESANIGDQNGDGLDDLAILFNTKTEIYYGGKFKDSPDLVIPTLGDGNSNFETGDFNGDGITDLIIVTYSRTNSPSVRSDFEFKLDLFLGGSDFATPILHLDRHDIGGENIRSGAYDVSNIGDFNNDGSEDFLLTFFGLRQMLIYYGGDSISETPDLIIDNFQSDFGITGLSDFGFRFGYRIQTLGDINGDSIDDFAIGDFTRPYEVNSERFNDGAVLIYFGSKHEKGELVDPLPNEVIALTEERFRGFRFFGWNLNAGDFNGDGENDLLVSHVDMPLITHEPDEEGKDGFLIYHGGTDFDTQYDQLFGLPAEVFNNTDVQQVGFHYGETLTVNDINNDGADEIFIGSHTSTSLRTSRTHGILIMGGASISQDQIPAIQFVAPNLSSGLGAFNRYVNISFRSAVGDFDGDGIPELVVPQYHDVNYRGRPIYTYAIQDPAKADQTIEFELNDQIGFTDVAVPLEATASSGLPVSYEVISGPASIAETNLLISGTGTIVIQASQPGNDTYNRAPLVQKTIIVSKADQTINMESIDDKTFGDEAFEVLATSSSGLAVALTIQSGPATIDGNLVSITGTGEITIEANQAGNENYNAATPLTITIQVLKADQIITIDPIENKVYDDAPFEVQAASDNGLPLTLSIASGPGTIEENLVTINGVGVIIIEASQAGNENYNANTQSVSVNVAKADQSITIEEIGSKTFGTDVSFSISGSTTSGLPLSFSITSGPGIIDDNTVSITGAGDIVIKAEQAGNENYNPADQSITVNVTKADQEISIETIEAKIFGDTPFNITASANSGLPVSLSVTSGPGTITDNTVTITGAGQIIISAQQPGDDNYNPAPESSITIDVSKADQTITFDVLADKTIDDDPFELSATTTSGLAITYSLLSGPVTIENNVVTLAGTRGTVEIQATQVGNENYNPATPVIQSFEVTLVTSAEVIEIQQDVSVFPNPVETEFTLEIKNMAAHKLKAIDISDLGGTIINSLPITQNSSGLFTIDLSDMKEGIYFLRLTFEKGMVIEKVLKQNK